MALLNPRVDFVFKKLFGSEENKTILIAFINAIVSEDEQIAEVTLLNPYNYPERATDKFSILDIKAVDKKGRHYNIEMQVTDQVYYNQRILYYWSKLYTDQLTKGNQYHKLRKTISISVLNFNGLDEPEYHNVFHVMNANTHKRYFEDFELHFIELEKFNKDVSHITTALERWTTFLTKALEYRKDTLPETMRDDKAIVQAMGSLEEVNMNKDEFAIYEARLKWFRDEYAALEKKGLVAYEEGIDYAKMEIAKTMLKDPHFELEQISTITQLSIDKLKKLKESC